MTRGRDVMNGIMAIICGTIIIIVDIIILGTVLDNLLYIFSGLPIPISSTFQPTLQIPFKLSTWFYFFMTIIPIILISWGFKLIFFSHPYSYPEKEPQEYEY